MSGSTMKAGELNASTMSGNELNDSTMSGSELNDSTMSDSELNDREKNRGMASEMRSETSYVPRPRRHSTWLVEGVEHLYAVLRIQLVWLLLTVLGLIVLGIAPATCAAADALRAQRRDELTRVLPLMWESYRRELIPANLRMVPLMAVQLLSLAMLWQAAAGLASNPALMAVLGTLGAIAAGWATVSLAAVAVAPRVRRQELLVTWRLALVMPGALPLRSFGLVLLVAAWAVLCSTVWQLAVLLGAGIAADIAVALLSTRIALLLEDLGGQDPAA